MMAAIVTPNDPYQDHAAIRGLMRRKRDEWLIERGDDGSLE